jgi:hypothetical protein
MGGNTFARKCNDTSMAYGGLARCVVILVYIKISISQGICICAVTVCSA